MDFIRRVYVNYKEADVKPGDLYHAYYRWIESPFTSNVYRLEPLDECGVVLVLSTNKNLDDITCLNDGVIWVMTLKNFKFLCYRI